MRKLAVILMMLVSPAQGAAAGLRDPGFARVPFAEWRAGTGQTRMRWSVDIAPPVLSVHQRMLLRVAIHIEADPAPNQTLFIEYRDAAGNAWQQHIEVGPARPGSTLGHFAFLLPGEYSVAFALWDPASGKHSLLMRKVRVEALHDDPLAHAWEGLPAVEFIAPADTANYDLWFLPGVTAALHLPVTTHRRVQVEVLLNATPAERRAGSMGAVRENMSLLIPALKVLAGLRLSDGALTVSMLDLTRRRTAFTQHDVQTLDWNRMRRFFSEANPGMVDVATLAAQRRMLGFFLNEVDTRLRSTDTDPRIVIVLSGPAQMEDQEPWDRTPPAPDPNRKLIYIRYRTDPAPPIRPRRPRPGMIPGPPAPPPTMPLDDLEHALEPMGARIFDATSAPQFRRILAAVIRQIAAF